MSVQTSKDPALGTREDPIVDAAMTEAEALEGLDTDCPRQIWSRQRIATLVYYSFDGKVHRGQLVIDRELEADVAEVFELAFELRFPICSVIPISDPRFRRHDLWDDGLSMEANNTSAFNYRKAVGCAGLSPHAFGRAIDINPIQNPYLDEQVVLPPEARYDPTVPGTLAADHPLVRAFLEHGWRWGGEWHAHPDYHHFDKVGDFRPPGRSLLERFRRRLTPSLAGRGKHEHGRGAND